MIFLKKDLALIIELAEEFTDIKKWKLKNIVRICYLDKIFEEDIEQNLSFNDFVKMMESKCILSYPSLKISLNQIKKNEKILYYKYIVQSLIKEESLKKHIVEPMGKNIREFENRIFCVDNHNLLGFNEFLEIPFLGVIICDNNRDYFQIFSIKNNLIKLKKIADDIDSSNIEYKLAEYFFGKENFIDLEEYIEDEIKNIIKELTKSDYENIKNIAYYMGEKYKINIF